MEKQDAIDSMKVIDGQKAVNFIIDNAEKFAEAHSSRVHLENMTKVVKSRLMQDCKNEPVSRAEAYALAHPDYCRYIVGDRESNNWEEYSVAQELWDSGELHKPQIRITFDGETGELKSAEVLR